MNEIQCPHCSKAFKVDETGYANILKQVYDHEFENQLSERLTQKEREQASELKLAKMDADITVQVCWDADRLDLGRVGIRPFCHKLCTASATSERFIEAAYRRSRSFI